MTETDFSARRDPCLPDKIAAQLLAGTPPAAVAPLDTSRGLSGAEIWQVTASGRTWCLRRWPRSHPTPQQLVWIHKQMRRATDAGCLFIPQLQATEGGDTFLIADHHLWELATWMPGAASYLHEPTKQKLQAGLRALAQVHSAWATDETRGPAPGIQHRHQLARQWHDGALCELFGRITDRGPSAGHAEIAVLCQEIAARIPAQISGCRRQLEQVQSIEVRLQPCLRDIWHDHLLFEQDDLTGLIDFGAMRVDSPAADLARLLGSLVGDDESGWGTGLQAYEEIRKLTIEEHTLMRAYDRANSIFAGINWIQWLFVDGREFDQRRVSERLRAILARLQFDR